MTHATMPPAEAGGDPVIGRRYLIAAIAVLLLSSLLVSGAFIARLGVDRLPQQITRIILLLILGHFLLRGRTWARWVTFALLAAAVWVGAGTVLRPGAFQGEQFWRTLPVLLLYAAHALIARGLLYSESVRAYFRQSRSARHSHPTS